MENNTKFKVVAAMRLMKKDTWPLKLSCGTAIRATVINCEDCNAHTEAILKPRITPKCHVCQEFKEASN